jgi:mono/diheme cytochrome c family protein
VNLRSKLLVCLLLVATVTLAQQATIRREPAPYTSPASAKEMYTAYCASCHGIDAKGDGPTASALKTAPTDLTLIAKNNGGKFPDAHVYEVIRGEANLSAHGSKDMPVWGAVFHSFRSDSGYGEVQLRIRNLTDYIESLQQK